MADYTVQIIFPTKDEKDAYAVQSVRKEKAGKTSDPRVKYLRTADGKEMGRNIEAYKKKYGEELNEIVIVRYDPKTGKDAGIEIYKPSDFDRTKRKK